MKKRKNILFLFGIMIVLVLACNLPDSAPTSSANASVDATMTALVLTQTAVQSQSSAEIPSFTPEVNILPTITPILSTSAPSVSVSVDTNCRSGPGKEYDYLTNLPVGVKAEVVGKYTSSNPVYWIIKRDSTTCWLWGQYATVEGDTSSLPEMTPPPTPTPLPTDTPLPTPTPLPTDTPLPTPTATTPPPVTGDLRIIEIFMSTQFEVVVRVKTNPTGSLGGNFQYTVYANGSQVAQGSCPVPTGSNACWTGYSYQVIGSQSIQVVIDSNNAIVESNEGNNTATVTCDAASITCN